MNFIINLLLSNTASLCVIKSPFSYYRSDIPRTDYRNFFAMLLERGVEVLSVAAFRYALVVALYITSTWAGIGPMYAENETTSCRVSFSRIFSEKAAQIPLIGTSRKYRRQGMCRLLMNELEKVIHWI